MKNSRHHFSSRYQAALARHLAAPSRRPSPLAQRLGRSALSHGLDTAALAVLHEKSMVALGTGPGFVDPPSQSFRHAARFLAQALQPIEAAQRETREKNAHLLLRNRMLRRHAEALAAGNRRLQREVRRREAGDLAVRQGREHYLKLFRESQAMQRQLRQLTRQVLSAQEEERKRISRELHDEVVQTLVGINVELAALGQDAAQGGRSWQRKISRTRRLVAHSVNAVHRFARELRPAVLDDLGLIPALHAYCKALAARKKLQIRLTVFSGVESLDGERRTVLFRIAQEALANVARHAHATQVEVNLSRMGGMLRMEIHDNGKSFSARKAFSAPNPKRLGLVGMKERVEMVGGAFAVDSSRRLGTTVRADVPFPPTC